MVNLLQGNTGTMVDQEMAMTAYLQLALLSQQKRQAVVRDRFLILAAAAACRAGWLDVAERSRTLLVGFAPHHQFADYANVPSALRDEDFTRLVTATERHCSLERAEHLLAGLGRSARGDATDQSRGDWAMELLDDPAWSARE